ncbi:MAG: heme o synthase [Myxococcales bacterium]
MSTSPLSAPVPAPAIAPWRDVLSLTKPRLALLNVFMTAGGMWLAPGQLDWATKLFTLLGTALVIGGACTLNCYLERDADALMVRTRNRPLPTGRLSPQFALRFGLALSALGVPMLTFGVNALTGLLGAVALISYVLVYTPMKRVSSHALLVGAVPGAIPPLMGWTAATGRVDATGLVLFSILFVWQVPHFLALSLVLKDDYARAGIKVTPLERGEDSTRFEMIRYQVALVLISLMLVPLGVAGTVYVFCAAILGLAFLGFGAAGMRREAGIRWARSVFGVSILYLMLLFVALMVDRTVGR